MAYSLEYVEEERRRRWPPGAATRRAGRICVAPRRCSSSAYRSFGYASSSRLAGLAISSSAATGGCETGSKAGAVNRFGRWRTAWAEKAVVARFGLS